MAVRILFLLVLLPAALAAQGRGYDTFERAYELEERGETTRAITLYEKALKLGLEEKIRESARWRLFYLYRDQGRYMSALDLLRYTGRGKARRQIERELITDIQRDWQVDAGTVRLLQKGLAYHRQRSPQRYFAFLQDAVRQHPENLTLLTAVALYCSQVGQPDDAMRLLNDFRGDATEGRLLRARLQSAAGDPAATLETLDGMDAGCFAWWDSPGLNDDQKFRLYDLRARAHRSQGDAQGAAAAFAEAAEYREDLRVRYRGLAAFTLYRDGRPDAAREMLEDTGSPEELAGECNVIVLYWLLQPQTDAKPALMRLRPRLREGQCSATLSRAAYERMRR